MSRWDTIKRIFDRGTQLVVERDDDLMGRRNCVIVIDDPALDGTPGAHPAWYRGNDAGVKAVTEQLSEILGFKNETKRSDYQALRKHIRDSQNE